MKKVSSKQGFTLIELVLVAGMLGVIGLSVYGTFANGIIIWKRVTQETATEDLTLFFEKVTFDLRNTFKLTGVRFRGERHKVTFPVRVHIKGEEGVAPSIGEVSYYFDGRNKALIREELNYSQIFRQRPGTKRVVAGEIQSLDFEYYVYDANKKQYSWVSHWQDRDETFGIEVEEQLPLIVRIMVGVHDANEKNIRTLNRTVQVPSACCWPLAKEDS